MRLGLKITTHGIAASAAILLCITPIYAQVSPLDVVMEGRAAASTSNLTEAGMKAGAQSSVNILLYICGFLGVLVVSFGIYDLYRAEDNQFGQSAGDERTMGIRKIFIGGLLTIPAIVAAIGPYISGVI